LEQLKKDVAKWQNSPILMEDRNGDAVVKGEEGNVEVLNLTTKTTTETTATDKEVKKEDGSEIRERSITSVVTAEIS
jgi:hypothetical protein